MPIILACGRLRLYVCIYIHIYIYIEREREREKKTTQPLSAEIITIN
jgi:hypothetical protein